MKTLLNETIRLLRERPRSQRLCDVVDACDGISMSWLSALLGPDPTPHTSVSKIEQLYNLLSPTPLFPPEETEVNEPGKHTAGNAAI